MPPSLIETLRDSALAWGVPVAYAVRCIVAHRLTSPKEVGVPDDLEPTHTTPAIHPLLLGALWFRRESEVHNRENACKVTMAVVIRMIGRGLASFAESSDAAPSASAGQKGGGTPHETGGASSRGGLFSHRGQELLYRTRLRLTINTRDLDRYDRDACELVVPPKTQSASMEDLCAYARDPGWHLTRLGRILSESTGALYATELVRGPGSFYSFLFCPFVGFLVFVWAMLGFLLIGIEPSTPVIAAQFAFSMAVMFIRFSMVDLGARLTPKGAQVVARARACVRWSEEVIQGDAPVPRDLTSADVTDLLSTLLAMGHLDLAAGMADALLLNGYASRDDIPGAQQAICFCTRRPLAGSVPQLKHEKSPAELILDNVHKVVRMLER